MATSTYVKCGNSSFEAKEATPLRSEFKLIFIQCSSCGGVVGVLDFFNVGNLLTQQHEALKEIAKSVGTHVNL